MVKKLEWIEMAQLAVSSILFKSPSLKPGGELGQYSVTWRMRTPEVPVSLEASQADA